MKHFHHLAPIAIVSVGVPLLGQDEASKMQSVQVLDQDTVCAVFVPAGNLVMMFKKDGLIHEPKSGDGATGSPRYFFFKRKDGTLVMSGWFEPASKFQGVQKDWQSNVDQWKGKPDLEPHDVIFFDQSKWKALSYKTLSKSIPMVHIKAHWVQSETWIDIHLSSVVSNTPAETLQSLTNFLASIVVQDIPKKN